MNFELPPSSRDQIRNVLAVALNNGLQDGPRPVSTYEPLAWLLREDAGAQGLRRTRRLLYRKLVRDLAREFDRIYTERLVAANGPWDFQETYEASKRARKCIRRMQWCALKHAFHLPGAREASGEAYGAMLVLLNQADDLNIA